MSPFDHLWALLPRDLIIDLQDSMAEKALQAYVIVRDHAGLDQKAGARIDRLSSVPNAGKGVRGSLFISGGLPLEGRLLPGTGLKIFQPFMRFGQGKSGLILDLAAMLLRNMLSSKNLSRGASVTLNHDFTPRLDFDGTGPKCSDSFSLFLISRDPARPRMIIDSEYESFLFYEPIEVFIRSYARPIDETDVSDESSTAKKDKLVKRKTDPTPFRPSEVPKKDDFESDSA